MCVCVFHTFVRVCVRGPVRVTITSLTQRTQRSILQRHGLFSVAVWTHALIAPRYRTQHQHKKKMHLMVRWKKDSLHERLSLCPMCKLLMSVSQTFQWPYKYILNILLSAYIMYNYLCSALLKVLHFNQFSVIFSSILPMCPQGMNCVPLISHKA